MSRRKKKSQHEEHMSESWLLPYSDLLTLLLALFIVLFAMSSVDAQKFSELSRAFNKALDGGTGVFEHPSPMPEGMMAETDPEKFDGEEEGTEEASPELEELKVVQEKIDTYINDSHLKSNLETSLTEEGLLLTIRDNVLFDSGIAMVRERDEIIAKEISELLVMEPPRNIIISGHTDNVPIRNAEFESNWELSVMRAVNFMKLLQDNKKLKPEWFSAKGFGEFKPVSPNTTDSGREKNRRVEILIMPRKTLIGE
ncbi:flagellar motor protein MotB [Bacillus sp. D386]|uniref:flagellar motor protein MotB n=1 Tax=Bacillus sp. D386 TaxID=2587155 RepID=UPI0011234AF1|nr:flagellar motor protein MotB [Bacillus sp. D386]